MKFEYEWRDTPLHRMHPIAKIALLGCIGGLSSMWMDFRYCMVTAVIAMFLWYLGKAPKKWILIPLLFSIGTQWADFLVIAPFLGYSYKVLPREYAMQVILDLGYIPILNLHPVVTVGALWWLLRGVIAYYTTVLCALLLYYTTSIPDLVQYILKFKVPNIITFSIIATFRFFPVMTRLSSDSINSQRLRGWTSSRNPLKFIKRMIPLMLPVTRQFMRATDIVTLAVLNRAFGAYPKRPHKIIPFPTRDKIITIISIAAFAIGVYLTVTPPYYGNL